MMWKIFAVILCITLVSASCPKNCRCPLDVPTCAAGVRLMKDSCGCCKVCVKQLFEDCSTSLPCDHTKGLECNFGGGYGSAKGICRAKSDGRSCEYNNKIYQNGEIFRPNCKHQCTCMDGAVSCVSLCPRELMLPKLGCAKPKRVKVPGRCCEQLLCPREAEISPLKKHRKKHSKFRMSENDLTNQHELAPVLRGEPELPAFRSHPVSRISSRGFKCVSHTTAWSPCSRSRGSGVSTRLTNNNTQCKLVTETRLCKVPPHKHVTSVRRKKQRGHRCNHVEKAGRPVKLSHAGCRSVKKFRLRDCGSCSEGLRCCRPHRTRTIAVRFRCRNGETFRRMEKMTKSCKCNCSANDDRKTPALHRLLNDID